MVDRRRQLLAALSDGDFHSGQSLADIADISRAAIWKQLKVLEAQGIQIEAVSGKGYRLQEPLQLLDEQSISAHLSESIRNNLNNLEVLFETLSTNQYLLQQLSENPSSIHARVVLAEFQSMGRGRGENNWLSAPASGLCLSLGWRFNSMPATLTALPLAVGVVLAQCLRQAGYDAVNLKWPNDLVVNGAKLGGILIESRSQIAGACDIVLGVGININLPQSLRQHIDKEVTDLNSLTSGKLDRNQLAAAIIGALIRLLQDFPEQGFTGYREAWQNLDSGRGKQAILLHPTGKSSGTIIDVDENGLLIMSVNGEQQKYSSGELSIRIIN